MTILAGFDFVSEISHAALLKQLASTPVVGEQMFRTPFELTVPGALGSAHFIVDKLELDINGDNTVTIALEFSKSSVTTTANPPASIHPLSGTITVNLRVVLEPTAPTVSVALDFAQCPVSLLLSAASQQLIAQAAALIQNTPAQLTATFEAMLRTYLQSRTKAILPGGYTVNPDVDGALQPLSLRTLRLRCFGPADKSQQGVGLFGNFFAETQNAGNPVVRERSAVPAAQDTLMALSLRSFRTFLWCPRLAGSLAGKLGRPAPLLSSEMPGTCGSAASIDVDEVTVTNIDAFFGQGRIQVNVNFEKSGTCYEASGSMVTYLRLTVAGGTITPNVEPQTPQVDVNVDAVCEIAGWILAGPIGGLLAQSIEDTLEGVAGTAALSAVEAMTGQSLNAPSARGIQLTGVAVSPEEIALSGRILAYQPPPPTSDLSFTLETKTALELEPSDGAWATQLWCQNRVESYAYTETLLKQSQRFLLRPTLIALPMTVTYSIRGGNGPWQKMLIPSNFFDSPAITVPALECRYPHPLPAGGSIVVQDVVLKYKLQGNRITLYSRKGDGNFAVDLRAEVLDGNGQPPPGVDAMPTLSVFFESDIVVMGEQYKNDLKECADAVKATSTKNAKSRRVPRWKQHFNEFERSVLDDLDFLNLLGTARGEDMARHYRNAYGDVLGQVVAAKRVAETVESSGQEGDVLTQQLQAIEIALTAVRFRQ